jgi:hypothetical protein
MDPGHLAKGILMFDYQHNLWTNMFASVCVCSSQDVKRTRLRHCDEDITMSTTTPAAPPHQAPLPSLAGPRAHARDLNFVMLLKNEGPEE